MVNPAIVEVPSGVITAIGPLVAPGGTTALMRVDVLELIVALMPSNVTTVAFSRRLPVMTTVPPTGLERGLNFKTTGSAWRLRTRPCLFTTYGTVDGLPPVAATAAAPAVVVVVIPATPVLAPGTAVLPELPVTDSPLEKVP